MPRALARAAIVAALSVAAPAAALDLTAAGFVPAGGVDIVVPGYSVPCWVDWNADGRKDLVVGEGGGTVTIGKVRVYLDQAASGPPVFADFLTVQSAGADLSWPALGCLGLFPCVVDWDDDGRKDLLTGLADGRVRLYLNVATDAAPAFDAGAFVACAGNDLDVGIRATPLVADWDLDGRKDLVCGAGDGRVRVYLNAGEDAAPVFLAATVVPAGAGDLVVPSSRSSCCFADLDGDGLRDLLTGNTDGQLLLYANVGAAAAPAFLDATAVTAGGVPIDLDGTPRSRPGLCDWNDDQVSDVLLGSGDGKVRLYLGPEPTIAVPDAPPAAPRVDVRPNPFNPRATIAFTLPAPGWATLSISDAAGRRVACRQLGVVAAGRHVVTWDGRDAAGGDAASGTYLVTLQTSGGRAMTRATLVR